MNASRPRAIACYLLAAVFALFTALQLNDLDPDVYVRPHLGEVLLWTALYGGIAALFALTPRRRFPPWLPGALGLLALGLVLRSAPGLWENLFGEEDFTMTGASMSAEDPRVELTREFFGGLIALAAALWLLCASLRARRSAAEAKTGPSREG